jgi:hypothetical protein
VTGISRRRFLGLGLAAAGVSAVGGSLRLLAPAADAATLPGSWVPSGSFDLAAWEPLVGSMLGVTASSGHGARLRLHAAEALPADRLLVGDGYRLTLWGVKDPVLPDGVSVLHHPSVGAFPATLLAINQPVQHQSYQLIVDRRRPVASRR